MQQQTNKKNLHVETKTKLTQANLLFRRIFRSKAAYFIHRNRHAFLALLVALIPAAFLLHISVYYVAYVITAFVGYAGRIFNLIIPLFMLLLAISVVIQSNPMHSLLSLIALFLLMVATYLSLKAEYLGLVFLIVYVGAVAILFLFVVMLIPTAPITRQSATYTARITQLTQVLGLILGALFVPTLYFGVTKLCATFSLRASVQYTAVVYSNKAYISFYTTGQHDILRLATLYSEHAALFVLITLILLIAMIGAIVLASPKSTTYPHIDS